MEIISYKEFTELCRRIVEKQLIPTSGRIEGSGYLLRISLDIRDAIIDISLEFDDKSNYKYCKAIVEFCLHMMLDNTEEIIKAEKITIWAFIAAKKLANTLQDYQIDFNAAWDEVHFEKYEWDMLSKPYPQEPK